MIHRPMLANANTLEIYKESMQPTLANARSTEAPTKHKQRIKRGSITLEKIVNAAIDILDTQGIKSLTMPQLANSLGCGTMTVYGYVSSKEELLQIVYSKLFEEIPLEKFAGANWNQALNIYASYLRNSMLSHPAIAQLLVGRQLWSLQVFQILEIVVNILMSEGASPKNALFAFRAVQTYTLGFTLHEISREESDQEKQWSHVLIDLDPLAYSGIHSVSPYLAKDASEEQFDWGLQNIINGIASYLPVRKKIAAVNN